MYARLAYGVDAALLLAPLPWPLVWLLVALQLALLARPRVIVVALLAVVAALASLLPCVVAEQVA